MKTSEAKVSNLIFLSGSYV